MKIRRDDVIIKSIKNTTIDVYIKFICLFVRMNVFDLFDIFELSSLILVVIVIIIFVIAVVVIVVVQPVRPICDLSCVLIFVFVDA